MAIPLPTSSFRLLRTVARVPVWCLSVFTHAKSFRDNPVIGSRLLNQLGLHVVRLVLAHGFFALRTGLLSFGGERAQYRQFSREGYLVWHNVLPPEEFAALQKEVRAMHIDAHQCTQGDSLTQRAFLDESVLPQFPQCKAFHGHAPLGRLLKVCSGKNEIPRLYVEYVRHHSQKSNRPDPQKTLHSDTFQPTMKAWFYLEDVGEHNGPLVYVPRSHRLSWVRLKWEYRRSLAARSMKDGYSEKGSFRIEESELAALGLPASKVLSVPANTLVIANTHGFHCRGDAKTHGATRLALWFSSRVSPFNPWVGVDHAILRGMRDKFVRCYMQHKEQKSARRGQKPSWAPVRVEGFEGPAS